MNKNQNNVSEKPQCGYQALAKYEACQKAANYQA